MQKSQISAKIEIRLALADGDVDARCVTECAKTSVELVSVCRPGFGVKEANGQLLWCDDDAAVLAATIDCTSIASLARKALGTSTVIVERKLRKSSRGSRWIVVTHTSAGVDPTLTCTAQSSSTVSC